MRERIAVGWIRPAKPRRGDTVACLVCGTEFYRQPAYIKQGRKLCSTECSAKWQSRNRQTTACKQCGTEFQQRPSEKHVFCSRACQTEWKTKRPTGRMHNGRPVVQNHFGYLTIYEPTHPAASRHNGRILEHRYVMEQKLGRILDRSEHVHHIDHNRQNNALDNLEVIDPTTHQNETMAYTQQRHRTNEERLAEYERRYGPLD